MRVQFVVGRYRPDRDGVAAYVERLTQALPDVGVQAQVTEWPGWRRFQRAAKADLVHVQFAPSAYGYSGGIGLLPLRAAPLVTTLHEYGWWSWRPVPHVPWDALWSLGEHARLWDRETLRLVPASRALIVTGEGHAEVVRRRLGRTAAVIPIGANIDVSFPDDRVAARRELGLPLDAPVLAFFGFVHPVKGLRYLFEAVARLQQSHPGLRLLVVGGWRSLAWTDAEADEFVDELRSIAVELGVTEAVTFTGFVESTDVSRYLRAADIAVLPFTHGVTAKSGSLLACWAHERPVVATEPPDGADPDVTGAVEPARVRDGATLEEAIVRLLASAQRRQQLVEEGRHRMAARSWAAVARAHADVYAGVLGQR